MLLRVAGTYCLPSKPVRACACGLLSSQHSGAKMILDCERRFELVWRGLHGKRQNVSFFFRAFEVALDRLADGLRCDWLCPLR